MNKFFYIALLAAGIALVVYGVNASNSLSSDFSRLFTGSPADKAIWLLVGGGVLAVIGAEGLLRSFRST
jgi:hypothetical protein